MVMTELLLPFAPPRVKKLSTSNFGVIVKIAYEWQNNFSIVI